MSKTNSTHTALDMLREQIRNYLQDSDEQVAFWRPRAFLGHIIVAALGAVITLLAGLNLTGWPIPESAVVRAIFHRQNLILLVGVFITVVSAWQAFYNHRERWVGYATLAERLRGLQAKVDILSRVSVSGECPPEILKEFEAILAEVGRIEARATTRKEPEPEPMSPVQQKSSQGAVCPEPVEDPKGI